MESIPCTLTPNQVRKIKRATAIQLSANAIDSTKQHPHALVLHPENAKKVKRAAKHKRGVRLQLSQPEIEGSGFLDDAWETMKSIGSTALGPIKQVYQAVAPVARAALPYAKPIISKYTGVPEQAIDVAADVSKSLFGAGKRGKRKSPQEFEGDPTIVNTKPVFSPAPIPLSANPIGGRIPRVIRATGAANGGSFKPAGGSFKPAGGAMMGYGRRGRGGRR